MAVDGYYDNLELQEKDNLIYDDSETTTTALEKDLRKTLQSGERCYYNKTTTTNDNKILIYPFWMGSSFGVL